MGKCQKSQWQIEKLSGKYGKNWEVKIKNPCHYLQQGNKANQKDWGTLKKEDVRSKSGQN